MNGSRSRKDALRAGSAEAKIKQAGNLAQQPEMHSVQAAPRQSENNEDEPPQGVRCTPCRQRRGKEACDTLLWFLAALMHSVQAAPRQRLIPTLSALCAFDALRAGSAEAKTFYQTNNKSKTKMHSVQAAPRQRGKLAALLF